MGRLPRPSKYVIVALEVALILGVAFNLLYIHLDPLKLPYGTQVTREVALNFGERGLPSIPPEVLDEQGSCFVWKRIDYWYHSEWQAIWLSLDANPRLIEPNYYLSEKRVGFPLTARSMKAVRYHTIVPLNEGTLWPTKGNMQVSPAVTYHPLGLILNPIIYALPIWLLLMGGRWVSVTRRARKRKRLGLCPRCAYDLDGLSVCPECGESITRPEGSACRSAP